MLRCNWLLGLIEKGFDPIQTKDANDDVWLTMIFDRQESRYS